MMMSIHWEVQSGLSHTAVFSMKHAGVWVELTTFSDLHDEPQRTMQGHIDSVLPTLMGRRYEFSQSLMLRARMGPEDRPIYDAVMRAVKSRRTVLTLVRQGALA